jgi:hypothetical protein
LRGLSVVHEQLSILIHSPVNLRTSGKYKR